LNPIVRCLFILLLDLFMKIYELGKQFSFMKEAPR
jgi:hypothetical protein